MAVSLILILSPHKMSTKLTYRKESARCGWCWNHHSKSLKGVRCCANRRGIYDFLL